ncbi:MAG: ABC transporter substrate-binding protein [Alphaproteobacteria bacterium]|nr:ABC transporter substrate-binding protein [Alphaproteobacteria bacterium]
MTRNIIAAVALTVAAAFGPHAAAATKDSISLGMTLEPPVLDPTVSPASAIREIVTNNLLEGLTRVSADGSIKPALAESWTISADGKTYTFKLRRGVKYHDGSPFSSADVVYSLKRAMTPEAGNPGRNLFRAIDKVEAPDAATVVITLKYPFVTLPYVLAIGDASIVSEKSVANNRTNPIGTGPFKFARWVKGDRVEMARNDDFRDRDKIKLRRVTFRFIPDPNAIVNALLAGDLDAYPLGVPAESVAQFKKDKRFKVSIGMTEGETIVSINNAKKPFDDIRVRRALNHAIDRRAVIEGVMSGYGAPIGSHFSPLHPAYVDLTGVYPHDPAKAKALLTEAGYGNGLQLTLRLPPPQYARKGGEVIAAQLAKVGVTAKLEPLEWAQWLDQVLSRKDYELTIISHTEALDYDRYGRENYYWNYANNKLVAGMVERADQEMNTERRTAILQDIQKQLALDAVNVFMFQLPKIGVWRANLVGLWENSPSPSNDLTEVHWIK